MFVCLFLKLVLHFSPLPNKNWVKKELEKKATLRKIFFLFNSLKNQFTFLERKYPHFFTYTKALFYVRTKLKTSEYLSQRHVKLPDIKTNKHYFLSSLHMVITYLCLFYVERVEWMLTVWDYRAGSSTPQRGSSSFVSLIYLSLNFLD